MTALQSAIDYRNKGLSVIPVKPDKRPFLKWEEFQKRKAEPQEIKSWFSKWPDAGVAIVTGKGSGIDVIDIDTSEGYELLAGALGTDVATFDPPIARSPRGGRHLYVATTGETNKAGFLKGVDYRGEGGYIVAPPTRGANGKIYEWMEGHSVLEVPAPPCPPALLSIINSFSLYRGGDDNGENDRRQMSSLSSNVVMDFTQGRRDETLFHVANCLVKGGMHAHEIQALLLHISLKVCSPPFPEKEALTKIQSALKRAEAREKNLAEEVRDWILSSCGVFLSSDVVNCLQVSSRSERQNLSKILSRLATDGLIERVGSRNGAFRRVETDVEPVNYLSAPTGEFPIEWPLGIHDHCIIYPGNIIVVAGSKSAGKTAFLMNVVKLNQGCHEIVYLNSEMGDTEFRKRLELFEDIKLSEWRFKAYHRSTGFADLITPERKVFIVDFLEVTTDFWKVAQYIQEIHRKLRQGIAIIALQKSDMKDTGRGGDFSKEKARLYLSLDYLPAQKANRIKITDAKAWRGDTNPRGLYRDYKLIHGSRYMPTTEWRD